MNLKDRETGLLEAIIHAGVVGNRRMDADDGIVEVRDDGRARENEFQGGRRSLSGRFRLMAVYGDVALASDRRTRKYSDASGQHQAPHRALLAFVKQGGQWHSAGGALVPMMGAK